MKGFMMNGWILGGLLLCNFLVGSKFLLMLAEGIDWVLSHQPLAFNLSYRVLSHFVSLAINTKRGSNIHR